MRNVLLVTKHEIIRTVNKSSFWFMTIVFPALILFLNIGTQVVARETIDNARADDPAPGEAFAVPSGYVDQAGIIRSLPDSFDEASFVAFSNESEALNALQQGEIDQFYLIPPDFLAVGRVVLVTPDFSPFVAMQEGRFQYAITYNLAGDQDLAILLDQPGRRIENISLAPPTQRDAENPLTFLVPFGTMFVFFFLITMSSGFMLASVSREKENRIVEILLLSLNPRQLMMGKILGLSVVAMLQMTIWMGGALLALNRGRAMLDTMAGFTLPPGFIIWGLLYFALGYLTYASLMGAIGALAPSAREAGQFTFVVLLPLMLPLWLNVTFVQNPNGFLATFLSLFPLTAPTSMMTRLAAGRVPSWQPLVGLVLLALTAYFFVTISARFFKADTLLSGAAIQWRRIAAELKK